MPARRKGGKVVMDKNVYLFVVAHPDDEILGAGATISKLTESESNEVYVCVMNSVSDIRTIDSKKMIEDMKETHRMLGVKGSFVGNFPTLDFNNVPHIELVRFIEQAIKVVQPDYIFTHHPSDLHNDHRHTSSACQVAARLHQRGIGNVKKVRGLYYMEVPSSTDWSLNSGSKPFTPDTFCQVMKEDVDAKIEALRLYDGVVRPFPHSRSEEALTALAVSRGTQIGCRYAEAFESVYTVW